jgi:DNA polymerase III delta subunit
MWWDEGGNGKEGEGKGKAALQQAIDQATDLCLRVKVSTIKRTIKNQKKNDSMSVLSLVINCFTPTDTEAYEE